MLTWRASKGMVVRAPSAARCQRCPSLFRNLLKNIEELQKSVSPTFSPLCLKNKNKNKKSIQELRLCCLFWQNETCFGIKSNTILMTSNSDTPLACSPTAAQVIFDLFDDAFTSVARAAATFQRNILILQVSKYVFKDVFYPTEHEMPGAEKHILQWGLFISKYSKKTETVWKVCLVQNKLDENLN